MKAVTKKAENSFQLVQQPPRELQRDLGLCKKAAYLVWFSVFVISCRLGCHRCYCFYKPGHNCICTLLDQMPDALRALPGSYADDTTIRLGILTANCSGFGT